MGDSGQERIHCMGIGGIGVSGLAMLLAGEGHAVTGCDLAVPPQIGRWLARSGIAVATGHSRAHLRGIDRVVATPAVPPDNPELAGAAARGIPVTSRGAALAAYAAKRRTVAVCGTHGKTTTSCFAAALLKALGRRRPGPAAVGWCIGGWTKRLGCVAHPPGDGAPFVIEADESDGTLALYRPAVTVVTSIERDHVENFPSFDALADCFRAVCGATSGKVVYCADDPLCRDAARGRDSIGYGFSPDAALRAEAVRDDAGGQNFTLVLNGEPLGGLRIGVPGRHNLLNALGAIGAALACGFGIAEIVRHLGVLDQLPARRFETVRCRGGFEVVADYSHHPTEIRALLDMVKASDRPVLAIFQPHRFSRTKDLLNDFPWAFAPLSGAGPTPDRLVLLPVYSAFEKPLYGASSSSLYAALRERHDADGTGVVPELAASIDEVFEYLVRSRSILEKYRVLVIGAGDVIRLVNRLKTARGVRDIAPKPFKVSFGVPAFADDIREIADEGELSETLASGSPVSIAGQGTNLLPPPLGVRGTLARLRNCGISVEEMPGGAAVATVGCGIGGARLLTELARKGLSGLEFMAGIPGTLGGWLAMNAGTRLGEIGDRVVSMLAYRRDGTAVQVDGDACGFSYRSCPFLEDKIAFSAKLRLSHDDPDLILTRMRECLEKRFDFGGLRTAGSAFRNPPGGFAGALLEEAGCKGMRVGGAFVSPRHANIVAAGDGATASDIAALLALMRERVEEKSGVTLRQEIVRL